MNKVPIRIPIILSLIYLLTSSCSTKYAVDPSDKVACEEKNYNGNYEIVLSRTCSDNYGQQEWGRVQLNIEQCMLKVNDLFGAYLAHEENPESWKTLNGFVDKNGRVSGSIKLQTLVGNSQKKMIHFYGIIEEDKLKARDSECGFLFEMNREEAVENIAINMGDDKTSKKGDLISSKDNEKKLIAALAPLGALGDFSEVEKTILFNSIQEHLSVNYALASQKSFEQAQEAAFEELDYDECTEDQCFAIIQQILQADNLFLFNIAREGDFTQLSLTMVNLNSERFVRNEVCEKCSISELNAKVQFMANRIISISLLK